MESWNPAALTVCPIMRQEVLYPVNVNNSVQLLQKAVQVPLRSSGAVLHLPHHLSGVVMSSTKGHRSSTRSRVSNREQDTQGFIC